MSQQSQLCFDQPIQVSKTKANASFVTQNLDLNDFTAFMPEGLARLQVRSMVMPKQLGHKDRSQKLMRI